MSAICVGGYRTTGSGKEAEDQVLESTLSTVILGDGKDEERWQLNIPNTCGFDHVAKNGQSCMLEWDVIPTLVKEVKRSSGEAHTITEVANMAYAQCPNGFLPEFACNLEGDYTAWMNTMQMCSGEGTCSKDGEVCAVIAKDTHIMRFIEVLGMDPLSAISYMSFIKGGAMRKSKPYRTRVAQTRTIQCSRMKSLGSRKRGRPQARNVV